MFAPEAARDDDGWWFRFAVLDGAGLLQHWHVLIPAQGAASFEQETVAQGLDVAPQDVAP